MMLDKQSFNFINPVVIDKDRGIFSNYWQRALSDLLKTLNLLIGSRTTGITTAVATGTLITHGLGRLPTFIFLSPQDGTPTNYYADNLTTTQFRLNYTGGGTHVFGWSAEI